jgi:hypothetical protein
VCTTCTSYITTKWKTQPKKLLGSLPLAFARHTGTYVSCVLSLCRSNNEHLGFIRFTPLEGADFGGGSELLLGRASFGADLGVGAGSCFGGAAGLSLKNFSKPFGGLFHFIRERRPWSASEIAKGVAWKLL